MKKPIIKQVFNGLFLLFAFVMLLYIVLELFIPAKTIDVLGVKSYVVVSSSMEPDIMVNDMIVIRSIKEEDLEVRDAISFIARSR